MNVTKNLKTWSFSKVKVSGEKYYHKSIQEWRTGVMKMGENTFDIQQGQKAQEMTTKLYKISNLSLKHVK